MAVAVDGAKRTRPRPEAEALLTAEDLLLMGDNGARVELVEGEIVEMPPSGCTHSNLGGRAFAGLLAYSDSTGAGDCTQADGGYRLSRDPDTVRVPDAAFVRAERLPGGRLPTGFFEGAPDLAVEVVSPTESSIETEAKVGDYLRAGARLVWVVYPELRIVRVHRANGISEVVAAGGTLSGEDVLPGFSLPLSQLFRD